VRKTHDSGNNAQRYQVRSPNNLLCCFPCVEYVPTAVYGHRCWLGKKDGYLTGLRLKPTGIVGTYGFGFSHQAGSQQPTRS
jgi:hypothetical protein